MALREILWLIACVVAIFALGAIISERTYGQPLAPRYLTNLGFFSTEPDDLPNRYVIRVYNEDGEESTLAIEEKLGFFHAIGPWPPDAVRITLERDGYVLVIAQPEFVCPTVYLPADIDEDGCVGISDIGLLVSSFGEGCP